jgi:hypothetical protein
MEVFELLRTEGLDDNVEQSDPVHRVEHVTSARTDCISLNSSV